MANQKPISNRDLVYLSLGVHLNLYFWLGLSVNVGQPPSNYRLLSSNLGGKKSYGILQTRRPQGSFRICYTLESPPSCV